MASDDDRPKVDSPVGKGSDGEDGLVARRAALDREIEQRRSRAESETAPQRSDASGFSQGLKLSTEFVAGVLVGAAIGWVFDSWLGTSPWGLVVFLLLGFAAGVLNVMRSAGLVREPGPDRGGRGPR